VRAGLSYSQVQKIELGKAHPSMASLSRIIDALGCQPGDLFDDSDRVTADQ
jgi:DNA-binding Xre family transcriptional regulator